MEGPVTGEAVRISKPPSGNGHSSPEPLASLPDGFRGRKLLKLRRMEFLTYIAYCNIVIAM